MLQSFNLLELQKKLKKELKLKRYMHTIGVQYTAANLAMRYGYDIEKAQVAALLHDCAKCFTDEEIKNKCQNYKLEISDIEERNPYLLHGKLGAYLAEHLYNIKDNDMLDAIIYHTTGKPNMGLLEKIIFTADYMEPGRPMILGLDVIRSQAYHDLDQTVYLILKDTLNYLERSQCKENKEIDPSTKQAYEYYKKWKGDL